MGSHLCGRKSGDHGRGAAPGPPARGGGTARHPGRDGADGAELRDHGGHGVTGEGSAAAPDAGPVEFGGIEFHRAGVSPSAAVGAVQPPSRRSLQGLIVR